jgi:hypothetical protein
VKCTGSRARPEEIDPGFEGQFGTGGMNKVSKKGKVRGSFKSKTLTYGYKGKFTKKRKASGTLYYRTVTPNRKCDSGAIKWKATR